MQDNRTYPAEYFETAVEYTPSYAHAAYNAAIEYHTELQELEARPTTPLTILSEKGRKCKKYARIAAKERMPAAMELLEYCRDGRNEPSSSIAVGMRSFAVGMRSFAAGMRSSRPACALRPAGAGEVSDSSIPTIILFD